MATSPQPVSLTGKEIHLSFGPNAVLRGVDIDVPAGTTAAVIGPSGSGKSTLLRTLNRLYEPDSGDILLDGRSVLRDNPDQLRQRIGMLDTAHIQVDATRIIRPVLGGSRAHPVGLVLLGAERFRIRRVDVTQLVPGAARPLWHHVGIAAVAPQPVAEIEVDVHPVRRLRQWW